MIVLLPTLPLALDIDHLEEVTALLARYQESSTDPDEAGGKDFV